MAAALAVVWQLTGRRMPVYEGKRPEHGPPRPGAAGLLPGAGVLPRHRARRAAPRPRRLNGPAWMLSGAVYLPEPAVSSH